MCKTCGKKIARRTYCSKECYGKDKRGTSRFDKYTNDVIDAYVNKKDSLQTIVDNFNISIRTLYRILDDNNIDRRGQTIDFTGMKIGHLTVIKKVETAKGKHQRWKCVCDCGDEYITSSQALSVQTITLSCEKCRRINSRSKEEITGYIWGQLQNRRKIRNGDIEFSVTKEYAYNLFLTQDRKCALSGVDICFADTAKGHQTGESTASLDRIDSSKGYVEDNVQWVHKRVNVMKNNMSDQEFIEWCRRIVDVQLG